jgi:hypothetical protein
MELIEPFSLNLVAHVLRSKPAPGRSFDRRVS